MRAAAGVTAFSSQSDLNLLDACFVRCSHTKGNIFPYFLCVSFLSTFPCRIKSILASYMDCMDCICGTIYGRACCFNQKCA